LIWLIVSRLMAWRSLLLPQGLIYPDALSSERFLDLLDVYGVAFHSIFE
jgi:hypothetical protein